MKNSVNIISVFFTKITASISSDTLKLKHIIGVFGTRSAPAPDTGVVRKNNFASSPFPPAFRPWASSNLLLVWSWQYFQGSANLVFYFLIIFNKTAGYNAALKMLLPWYEIRQVIPQRKAFIFFDCQWGGGGVGEGRIWPPNFPPFCVSHWPLVWGIKKRVPLHWNWHYRRCRCRRTEMYSGGKNFAATKRNVSL